VLEAGFIWVMTVSCINQSTSVGHNIITEKGSIDKDYRQGKSDSQGNSPYPENLPIEGSQLLLMSREVACGKIKNRFFSYSNK